MFQKILIANRGEIACRIMRTARRLGIATVAVHSDADADALHVRMADEAVAIGPAAAAESYLSIPRVLDACAKTGAEAVHPGYGFLSERAAFAEALAAAGVAFIGPPPAAIAAMGDKIRSKQLAEAAGVSTLPGYLGAVADAEEAILHAERVGYPVMLKASAGGGGKGMRIVRSAGEMREAITRTKGEALTGFGDDRVFIERYVERPRHIEIQILGDQHGTLLWLGERECSIQRRHQKVIEEQPSPFLDEATRRAMGEQAVALARAVGYFSAGTVEFIVDQDRRFAFLEMNTRLQVEHPVTECVTGLDLVEWMIRIAAGERLTFGQADVRRDGWAVEARIYAEDPARGFLPSIGRLKRYRTPEARQGREVVRLDTGVYEGAEISIHYDPMIAKLVTAGPTRAAALDAMAEALDAIEIDGVANNVEFLSALVALEPVRAGELSTGLIAEHHPEGFKIRRPEGQELAELTALAASLRDAAAARERGLSRAGAAPREWIVRVDLGDGYRELRAIVADPEEGGEGADVIIDGTTVRVRGPLTPGLTRFAGSFGGVAASVRLARSGVTTRLSRRGRAISVMVLTPRVAALMATMPLKAAPDLGRHLLSPMPGLLVSLAVGEGARVKAGEPLAVVEAMKMENVLLATRDGTVARVLARPGASLAVDEVIIEFAP